jgi:hypothetical protein
MAVGMPEPRSGQVEQFLGELHKRGGLCAKSAGGLSKFQVPPSRTHATQGLAQFGGWGAAILS